MILALSMSDLRTFSLPVLPAFRRGFYFSDLHFRLAQQLRQLGKNCGDALRLVAREQLAAESATRLLFEIYIGKGLPIGVLHHETAIQLLDGPRRREVEGPKRCLMAASNGDFGCVGNGNASTGDATFDAWVGPPCSCGTV